VYFFLPTGYTHPGHPYSGAGGVIPNYPGGGQYDMASDFHHQPTQQQQQHQSGMMELFFFLLIILETSGILLYSRCHSCAQMYAV